MILKKITTTNTTYKKVERNSSDELLFMLPDLVITTKWYLVGLCIYSSYYKDSITANDNEENKRQTKMGFRVN